MSLQYLAFDEESADEAASRAAPTREGAGARVHRGLDPRQGLGRGFALPEPVLGQEQPSRGPEITAEVHDSMNDEPDER